MYQTSVESLESRRLLSSSITINGDVVTVVGTNAADHILVEINTATAFPSGAEIIMNGWSVPLDLARRDTYRFRIRAKAGDDNISVDYIFGQLTDTQVRGGRGNDTIELNGTKVVAAYVAGNSGHDNIEIDTASSSPDPGLGGPGATVLGGGGDDTLRTMSMDDEIRGGPGNDSIRSGAGNDTVYGDEGDDSIQGEEGTDCLYGGPANDQIDGGKGADRLFGNAGSDTLIGGSGIDFLKGGTGQDSMLDGPRMLA